MPPGRMFNMSSTETFIFSFLFCDNKARGAIFFAIFVVSINKIDAAKTASGTLFICFDYAKLVNYRNMRLHCEIFNKY